MWWAVDVVCEFGSDSDSDELGQPGYAGCEPDAAEVVAAAAVVVDAGADAAVVAVVDAADRVG